MSWAVKTKKLICLLAAAAADEEEEEEEEDETGPTQEEKREGRPKSGRSHRSLVTLKQSLRFQDSFFAK